MKKLLIVSLAMVMAGALGLSAFAEECPGGGGTCPLPTKEPK